MFGKRRVSIKTISLIIALPFIFSPLPIFARMMAIDTANSSYFKLSQVTALPNLEQCIHKTGRLWFTVSNYGIFGNGRDALLRDCLTGGFSSSAEYPGGSKIEYLFQGALWIGGIVGKDTLTSIGTESWVNIRELFPETGSKGSIIRRSARPTSPLYSPDAVSDMDFVAVYYDTLKDPRLVTTPDPEDGKVHKPLGLKIEQKSYSWVASWGQDWVFLDYIITNLGPEPIKKAYVGLFVDHDIGHTQSGKLTHNDDYCGFKDTTFLTFARGTFTGIDRAFLVCTETLNIAYAYDNDGDPEPGDDFSLSTKNPTGALGVRFLRAREPIRLFTFPAPLAFNWWIPDSLHLSDWGPQRDSGRASIFGGRGQPIGDAMRYYYLSNQEIDYDQVFAAMTPGQLAFDFDLGENWRPPHQFSALDIANGADSRFLFSVGPFDLGVGDSLPVTAVVLVGPRLHLDPANFEANFPEPSDFQIPAQIRAYKSKLDLRGIIENSRMARKVFDNENVRSPILCRGGIAPIYDSARIHGDGIPDFRGPVPPPYPKVEFLTAEGAVTLRWFGRETETALDPVTGVRDFEGYTLYMSPDGVNFTLVGYFDLINWRVHFLNRDLNGNGLEESWEFRWEPAERAPMTYAEIQNNFAVFWDTCANRQSAITKPIDPRRYTSATIVGAGPYLPSPNPWCSPDTNKSSIRIRFCDACGPNGAFRDTLFYFEQEGLNLGMDKIRMYPTVTDPDNDSAYWYQFTLGGLLPSQPLWFTVSPFDNGFRSFSERVDPQEAPPYADARLVYPIATDSVRRAGGLKISIYPNPYRIDHDYSYFEKKYPLSGQPQSSKRINFINLPPKATIRIYTLDGDLVQQINHEKNPNASDSGFDFWDLLSRNAQPVVAGLYIVTVESPEGRYFGKVMIIQ